jgi:sugar lactone lactonase YvrE
MAPTASHDHKDLLGAAGAAGPAKGLLGLETIDDWDTRPGGSTILDVASIALDGDDRVYLLTRHEGGVSIYEHDGTFVKSWGRGVFTGAHGITLGPDDSVYCADYLDHTVRKFSLDGDLLWTLGTPNVPSDTGYDGAAPGSVARRAGPFNGPTSCAIGPDGRLYISDGYGNAAIHVFDENGTLLYSFGEPGSEPGQFRIPHAIVFTPDGHLAVADRDNDRIQFLTTEGEVVDIWTHLQRPAAIFIAADGRYYIAELFWRRGSMAFSHGRVTHDLTPRVCVARPDGTVIARWGGPQPCEPGSFAAPHDVAVDSHGDLYVAETGYSSFGVRGLLPLDCQTVQKFRVVEQHPAATG